MARINEHYRKLAAGYLFPEIARRVRAFAEANPTASIIRLGIGDVTLPLAPAVVDALRRAAVEMGTPGGFRGYAPDQGYEFLRAQSEQPPIFQISLKKSLLGPRNTAPHFGPAGHAPIH